MTIWWLLLILASLMSTTAAFVWVAFKVSKAPVATKGSGGASVKFEEAANQEVEHIFSTEFREELRNRGRLHFEKIIGENAMFLQQDLRLTTSQLNEYMSGEITRKLQEEFAKYEQSITDAKQIAIESIQKTNAAIDDQRQMITNQLQKEATDAKERLLKRFEENTADVISHYVVSAVGSQLDLSDQLEYIIGELERNKQAIREDVINGA